MAVYVDLLLLFCYYYSWSRHCYCCRYCVYFFVFSAAPTVFVVVIVMGLLLVFLLSLLHCICTDVAIVVVVEGDVAAFGVTCFHRQIRQRHRGI